MSVQMEATKAELARLQKQHADLSTEKQVLGERAASTNEQIKTLTKQVSFAFTN